MDGVEENSTGPRRGSRVEKPLKLFVGGRLSCGKGKLGTLPDVLPQKRAEPQTGQNMGERPQFPLFPVPQGAHDFVDGGGKLAVGYDHGFDLTDGVDHCGMVLAAEILADLGQGKAGHFFAHKHRNLSGFGDLARVGF